MSQIEVLDRITQFDPVNQYGTLAPARQEELVSSYYSAGIYASAQLLLLNKEHSDRMCEMEKRSKLEFEKQAELQRRAHEFEVDKMSAVTQVFYGPEKSIMLRTVLPGGQFRETTLIDEKDMRVRCIKSFLPCGRAVRAYELVFAQRDRIVLGGDDGIKSNRFKKTLVHNGISVNSPRSIQGDIVSEVLALLFKYRLDDRFLPYSVGWQLGANEDWVFVRDHEGTFEEVMRHVN